MKLTLINQMIIILIVIIFGDHQKILKKMIHAMIVD